MTGAFMCLSCLAFLEMFTKPVTTIATTATHAGCVQCRLGRRMPFKVQQHFHCRRRPKTRILQLDTEGLTANKISIIEQLEQGIHDHPTRDPLRNCRQVSDSQVLTSWVSSEQKPWPCYVCSRAVRMDVVQSVSRTIRE